MEQAVVNMAKDNELVDVTIHWRGGSTSQHRISRPMARYDQHRDFDALLEHMTALRRSGIDTESIAKQLNAEGFRPPRRRVGFNEQIVRKLLFRAGVRGDLNDPDALQSNEWWVPDLAKRLAMNAHTLRSWVRRGWINGRRSKVQKYWILWADDEELCRLGRLVDASKMGTCRYPAELTTPKQQQR